MSIAKTVELNPPAFLDGDSSSNFLSRERERIHASKESPLSAYARYLARLELQGRMWEADKKRLTRPVTDLFLADIEYAKAYDKNRIIAVNGQTGTLKSFSGITVSCMLDENGFYTHRLGNYDFPKMFWNYEDLLDYARTDIRNGDMLMMDEEPRIHGVGSVSLNDAIHNLEHTIRRKHVHMMFVYVISRSHKPHFSLYTRGEHHVAFYLADYAVLGILVPVRMEPELLGLITLDCPNEHLISAYHKRKDEFLGGMVESGGYGRKTDLFSRYKWLLEDLSEDENFMKLKTKTSRKNYVSQTYNVPKDVADILIELLLINGSL